MSLTCRNTQQRSHVAPNSPRASCSSLRMITTQPEWELSPQVHQPEQRRRLLWGLFVLGEMIDWSVQRDAACQSSGHTIRKQSTLHVERFLSGLCFMGLFSIWEDSSLCWFYWIRVCATKPTVLQLRTSIVCHSVDPTVVCRKHIFVSGYLCPH